MRDRVTMVRARRRPARRALEEWEDRIQAALMATGITWSPGESRSDRGEFRARGQWGEAAFFCLHWPRVEGPESRWLAQELVHEAPAETIALLLVGKTTAPARAELGRQGVNFIDRAGNASIRGAGLHIEVRGVTPDRRRPNPPDLKPATGARLVYLLLKNPGASKWKYRDLAGSAGIALGSVAKVVEALRAQDFLTVGQDRQRRLQRRGELRRTWARWYRETLRRKLELGRYRLAGELPVDQLSTEMGRHGASPKVLAGGELGAALLTGHLRPATATLHVWREDEATVARQLRLIPDEQGPVQILARLGDMDAHDGEPGLTVPLADPLLVWAEMLVTFDERLREVARLIEQQFLERRDDGDTSG